MTITAFDIWIIGTLDGLLGFFAIGFTASIAVFLFKVLDFPYFNEDKKGIIISACVTFVFGFLLILTPSSKTAAAMMVVPAIVNSEVVQELPREAVDAARSWLKDVVKGEQK